MKHERYFGLHFDFHAGNTAEIGLNTIPEDIEKYITDSGIDFIQCDCKGHPGNTCYPSALGNSADNLKADNLKVWVDTAKKHNLPIYMHYSGVMDTRYLEKHPEQQATPGNHSNAVTLFGPYADDLLIPQLKELSDKYGVAGVWIDGDCWAVERDSSAYAKPHLKENMTEQEHNEMMREAYTKYLKHYVDALHAHNPDFVVASNWAYTSYMPESIKADVDFLSGDYPNYNSVHIARYEARCIANRGKPWDLMAWGFEWTHGTEKPAPQLMQEAAMTLSLGGGFQVYVTQNKDGSAKRSLNPRFIPLGKFMKERKALNFKKEPFAEVALYCDEHSRYANSNIYNAAGATNALIGGLECVLDAQYTAGILYTYQLDEQLKNYKAVYVPEWEEILPENKQKLLEFAKTGGHLIVSGAKTCMQFSASPLGDLVENTRVNLLGNDQSFALLNEGDTIKLTEGNGALCALADLRYPFGKAYRTDSLEKGKITYIPFALGLNYYDHKNYMFTDLIRNILGTPVVEINQKYIDITLQKDADGVTVNLINLLQGRHSLNYTVYDFVPERYGVKVKIHGSFTDVNLPLGEAHTVKIHRDYVEIALEKLEIHSLIQLKGDLKLC
ncbi:MAG: alpha-L-fucosidase [Clostridia bacterium]|nr:alpha-L-fucosidase [Clostridia bacterium]